MSRLLVLLTSLLLLANAASTQAGQNPKPIPDPQEGGAEAEGDATVEDAERLRIERAGGVQPPPNVPAVITRAFGINVNVIQDPVRIAPGQTGKVVLHVLVPKLQDGIRPGAAVEWTPNAPGNEPFQFGQPQADPPKKGRARYGDHFLVTVPVTVQPGTKHDSYDISGTMTLRGRFVLQPEGQMTERAADGGADPAGATAVAPPPPTALNEAKISFRGRLVVGPPVPKPVVQGAGRAPKGVPGTPSATSAGETAEPGVVPEERVTGTPGPGDGAIANRRPESSGGTPAPIGSGAGGAAPGGDLDLLLKVGGILVALVLLILILRGRGGS